MTDCLCVPLGKSGLDSSPLLMHILSLGGLIWIQKIRILFSHLPLLEVVFAIATNGRIRCAQSIHLHQKYNRMCYSNSSFPLGGFKKSLEFVLGNFL